MNIVTEINEWQALRKELGNQSIGLVHTMGNLHAGHLSLCKRAREENAIAVAAIYINPKQFNQAQDFALYPRTLEQDQALLMQEKMDYLLLFSDTALYPDQYQIQVQELTISQELEGEYRPGHFTGMLTIVLKFLNLVQASRSYYGEKDFQQLMLIKKMAQALFLPTEIIGCHTVRATDGLALSSRNNRLSDEQRAMAAHFPRLLHNPNLSVEEITNALTKLNFKVDYIIEQWQRRLAAVWVDDIRLIDNVSI